MQNKYPESTPAIKFNGGRQLNPRVQPKHQRGDFPQVKQRGKSSGCLNYIPGLTNCTLNGPPFFGPPRFMGQRQKQGVHCRTRWLETKENQVTFFFGRTYGWYFFSNHPPLNRFLHALFDPEMRLSCSSKRMGRMGNLNRHA